MPDEQNLTTKTQEEGLKNLFEENQRLLEEVKANTEYIKKYIFWSKVMGVLKILLIVVPLIFGILYLPSLLNNTLEPYKELLGISSDASLKEATPTLLKDITR